MMQSRPVLNSDALDGTSLDEVVERLILRLERGERVDREFLRAEYPACAGELERLLPTIHGLVDLSESGPADMALEELADAGEAGERRLGDYRIVQRIGRGGMGIVYEAEQLSLNRRVALKTLPTAAVLDPRTLQRFKNEAQAAAALDHPHIVAVYGVGVERGVHYYAMRLIDGCTLADVVAELRVVAGKEGSAFGVQGSGEVSKVQGPKSKVAKQTETRPIAGLSTFSTLESLKSQQFFRAVEEQFAEAENVLRRGLAIRDDWAEAHCNLGLVLLAQDKVEAAATAFQRAVALKPGFKVAVAGLETCVQRRAAETGTAEP
jgi:hypothetical protein